jgi:hypothetical protein
MYSQSVHAQNLADSEQKRLTSEPIAGFATDRISFTDMLSRQLARIGLPVQGMQWPTHRIAVRARAVMWMLLLLTVTIVSLILQFAAEKVTPAEAQCVDMYRAVDANVLVSMTTEELAYLQAILCPSGLKSFRDS